MFICLSVPLLEVKEQGKWISRKWIYFPIVSRSFSLNFDSHETETDCVFTFVISPLLFFYVHAFSGSFLNFLLACPSSFLWLIFKIPHYESYSSFLYILWIFSSFFCLSIFIYWLIFLIIQTVVIKLKTFSSFYSHCLKERFRVAYKYALIKTQEKWGQENK